LHLSLQFEERQSQRAPILAHNQLQFVNSCQLIKVLIGFTCNRLSSLLISCFPTAMMSSPFFQIKTNPSENETMKKLVKQNYQNQNMFVECEMPTIGNSNSN